jgi:ferritin-like metal-binding protein YciE
MANYTLRDLYVTELQDLYGVERQIIESLPAVISATHSQELRDAFTTHRDRTRIHAERLELLMTRAGVAPRQTDETPIDALIQTARQRIADSEDPHVRDAALAAAAQHIEHYEIAGYGCARSYARMLDDDDAAELLQQTLDEEGEADKQLTRIAEATIERTPQKDKLRPRLRYVALHDLNIAAEYRDYKVRNTVGDDLGRVDGLLIDRHGKPVYLGVDSGGWFTGRRYIVPFGKVTRRADDKVLSIGIDKETFNRYPAFHRDAFEAMSDDEARRYEWRVLEALDPKAARPAVAGWEYEQFACFDQPDWLQAVVPTTTQREVRIEVPEPEPKTR